MKNRINLLVRHARGRLALLLAPGLRPLATDRCANYTGRHTCRHDSTRTPTAPYLADRYCEPCIVKDALGVPL